MSEFLYNGKTLAEVAGYDDVQMTWVLCRSRDESGRLQRRDPDLPWWVEVDAQGMRKISPERQVSFGRMWQQVKKKQGLSPGAIAISWEEFLKAHPNYQKGRKQAGKP